MGRTSSYGLSALTEKQKAVFEFIKAYIAQKGFPPTRREIADKFNVSINTAHLYVRTLENKNVLTTTPGLSRSIQVTA